MTTKPVHKEQMKQMKILRGYRKRNKKLKK